MNLDFLNKVAGDSLSGMDLCNCPSMHCTKIAPALHIRSIVTKIQLSLCVRYLITCIMLLGESWMVSARYNTNSLNWGFMTSQLEFNWRWCLMEVKTLGLIQSNNSTHDGLTWLCLWKSMRVTPHVDSAAGLQQVRLWQWSCAMVDCFGERFSLFLEQPLALWILDHTQLSVGRHRVNTTSAISYLYSLLGVLKRGPLSPSSDRTSCRNDDDDDDELPIKLVSEIWWLHLHLHLPQVYEDQKWFSGVRFLADLICPASPWA